MNRLFLILACLLPACAAATTSESSPGPDFVFVTQTASPAAALTLTDELLPFRDLSTATPTLTPIPPSATPAPTVPTATPWPVVIQPTAPPVVAATRAPVIQPTSPPAPPAVPIQPAGDASGAEQAIIDLTNSYRAQNGLPPLARDENIMAIARSRSADMVARGYFGHTDPLTGAALAKPQVLALGYGQTGENIYWSGAGIEKFPAQAVGWFMDDAPHRANILNAGYTAIGVGVVSNGLGWTLTQNFGGP